MGLDRQYDAAGNENTLTNTRPVREWTIQLNGHAGLLLNVYFARTRNDKRFVCHLWMSGSHACRFESLVSNLQAGVMSG